MKKILSTILLSSVVIFTLSSCKKDEDSPSNDTALTDQVLNGVLKGTLSGNTREDSLAFSIDYLYPYEYSFDNSEWEDNGNGTVDIFIERYQNDGYDNYAYLEVEGWNPSTPITSASYYNFYLEGYFNLGNGKTLRYYGGAEDGDNGSSISFSGVSFNQTTGKFTVKGEINFVEGTGVGDKVSAAAQAQNSTDNPGTMSFEYSGKLYADNVVNKVGK